MTPVKDAEWSGDTLLPLIHQTRSLLGQEAPETVEDNDSTMKEN